LSDIEPNDTNVQSKVKCFHPKKTWITAICSPLMLPIVVTAGLMACPLQLAGRPWLCWSCLVGLTCRVACTPHHTLPIHALLVQAPLGSYQLSTNGSIATICHDALFLFKLRKKHWSESRQLQKQIKHLQSSCSLLPETHQDEGTTETEKPAES